MMKIQYQIQMTILTLVWLENYMVKVSGNNLGAATSTTRKKNTIL